MQAYTVFYCIKHNKGILIENIYKDIPILESLCNIIENNYNYILDPTSLSLDNCKYVNIGYITINNNIITTDITHNIYFLNLSLFSVYDKKLKLIKLDDTNPLVAWINYNNIQLPDNLENPRLLDNTVRPIIYIEANY